MNWHRLQMMRTEIAFMLLVVGSLFTALPGQAGDLRIAAASDLNFAFKELAGVYEQKTGVQVKLTLGSSGNFFAQIQQGAPFDLYFSADIAYPQKLIDAGLAVSDSLYHYATGRIVVWSKSDRKPDVAKGIEALLDPSIRKIAIANPRHAPYGRAAIEALEHFDVYKPLKDKLVFGENVSQTAQFVESGAADIGIIALSLASAPAMRAAGQFWLIPQEAHGRIDQGAVIVRSSKAQDAARSFLEFLQTPESQSVMKRYGFVLSGQDRISSAR